jgi:hypothetical protein
MATLLELPFCKKDPGKNCCFAMWPLGRPAGAGGPIPASSPGLAAGEGLEKGLGCPRRRFEGLDRP